MTESISMRVDGDGIALLSIDAPGRAMNVLSDVVLQELDRHVERLGSDDAIRGAVIASAKSSFVAGADLKEILGVLEGPREAATLYRWIRDFNSIFRRLETCGKPVVAAINGTALGGGLELCLACHHRVAADNGKAVIGLPEVRVGLLPGAGGTQRLPRLIGIEKALPLMVQGRHLRPAEALELGIVDQVVPADQLLETARRWLLENGDPVQPWDRKGFRVPGGTAATSPRVAQAFCAGTALVARESQRNYPAPLSIMSCVYEGTLVPLDTGLRIEARYFAELLLGSVPRNLIRSLFVNKGAADKLSLRPGTWPSRQVRRLGVLGAGMMGSGIATVAARAGMEVVLLDTSQELAERGLAHVGRHLQARVDRGRATAEESAAVLARVHAGTDFGALAGSDLVIEAVFEDRRLKAEVTARAEAVVSEACLFASNTSTLPISGLAEASVRPRRFIGLHFFSPVERMPLVEVIVGRETSEESVAHALDFVAQLRKTPILVNDSRGFYTSRVFSTYVDEGLLMLAEGVSPALIENGARRAGMAVGPLAVSDEVTIELQYKIARQTELDLGPEYRPLGSFQVVRTFYEHLQRWGRRYGKGFYDYPRQGGKRLWPGLADLYPAADRQPSLQQVERRLLYRQSLETVRCMDEGVIGDPAHADLGSILGWGFPAWSGGVLSLIETVGLERFNERCDRLAESLGPRFRVPDSLRERAREGRLFHARP